MFTSPYSANVILAKARAMYGNSLKTADYNNMLNCHSVSEIASYLKNNTSYASVLSDINEATIHRGHLESLLKRKLFNDYASLSRYDEAVGLSMTDFLIQRTEIELIISCLRLMSADMAGEFFFSLPMFFSSHTGLDFAKMSRSKNYGELLEAVKSTEFYDVLAEYSYEQNREINLTEIETALYGRLVQTVHRIISGTHGSSRAELKGLFDTHIDVQNVTRILRLKRFFNANPETIRANLLPYGSAIPEKVMESMINAPDADSVMDIFLSTKIGRKIPESQRVFTHDLHHRAPYFAARKLMHYSIHPSVVLLSYIFITDVELDDIINIIEGIRYQLKPDEIRPMLVLANY